MCVCVLLLQDWQEVVKLYEKDSVYLAEAGHLLMRNVQFEIPFLRRLISKGNQIQAVSMRATMQTVKNNIIFHLTIIIHRGQSRAIYWLSCSTDGECNWCIRYGIRLVFYTVHLTKWILSMSRTVTQNMPSWRKEKLRERNDTSSCVSRLALPVTM